MTTDAGRLSATVTVSGSRVRVCFFGRSANRRGGGMGENRRGLISTHAMVAGNPADAMQMVGRCEAALRLLGVPIGEEEVG